MFIESNIMCENKIESIKIIQRTIRGIYKKREEFLLRIKNSLEDDSKDEFVELISIANEVYLYPSVYITENVDFNFAYVKRTKDAMSYNIPSKRYAEKCKRLVFAYERAFPIYKTIEEFLFYQNNCS